MVMAAPTSNREGITLPTYMPWMDGIRAVAVLSVMSFHERGTTHYMWDFLPWGALGVDVFFAISGFLITTILLRELRDRNGISFRAFYLRRVRRLIPALAVMLTTIAIGVALFSSGTHRSRTLVNLVLAASYVNNWVAALSHHSLGPMAHTWSLAAEEQFYLVWPALLVLLAAVGLRGRRLVAVLGGMAAIAFLWAEVGVARHWTPARLFTGLDTRGAAGLLIGATLGAAVSFGVLPTSGVVGRLRRAAAAVGVIGVLVMMHDLTIFDRVARILQINPEYLNELEFGLTSLFTALLIWELLASAPHVGHRVLSWLPLVAIGRISYALYLWDLPVSYGLSPSFTGLGGDVLVPIHFVVAFALAIASWFVVERRFTRRRPTAPLPQIAPAVVSS